jgi:hypothetical protein
MRIVDAPTQALGAEASAPRLKQLATQTGGQRKRLRKTQ